MGNYPAAIRAASDAAGVGSSLVDLLAGFCQNSRQLVLRSGTGRLQGHRIGGRGVDCVACGSAAVTERPERTARGYRRFRCRDCGKQYNERSGTVLNHAHYPSDVIALVVLWRLR